MTDEATIRIAILSGERVVDIIIGKPVTLVDGLPGITDLLDEDGAPRFTLVEAPDGVGPAWRLVDGQWLKPEAPDVGALRDAARAAVLEERDRQIDAGVTFAGTLFQTRPGDRENIAGAAQLALMAIVLAGAAPGDLRWHGGASDFVWIAADNGLVPMDAPTVIAFAKAAAARKSACIFVAKARKAEIDAADAEALATFDVTAGWPA